MKQANTAANKAFTAPVRRTLREKPMAAAKHQFPVQAMELRYLPGPASPTRLGRCAPHAYRPFSCQPLPSKEQAEARHLRPSRATDRSVFWPHCFQLILVAGE